MKITAGEIRAALFGLPDDTPVEFTPITSAFTGTERPLRFEEVFVYKDGGDSLGQPDDDGSFVVVFVKEDRESRARSSAPVRGE